MNIAALTIDEVKEGTNGGALTTIGSFENTTDIDNTASALTKWRSTGKPPQPFHHVQQLNPGIGLLVAVNRGLSQSGQSRKQCKND